MPPSLHRFARGTEGKGERKENQGVERKKEGYRVNVCISIASDRQRKERRSKEERGGEEALNLRMISGEKGGSLTKHLPFGQRKEAEEDREKRKRAVQICVAAEKS